MLIDAEVWEKLRSMKREKESFSAVISRLIEIYERYCYERSGGNQTDK